MQTPTIKLKGYRLLIQLDNVITDGSLVLPEKLAKVKNRGTVAGIGDGRWNANGDIAPFDVSVGDRVLLSEYAVTAYFENGNEYRIVSGEDVLGVL